MTRPVADQLAEALAALPTEPDEIARVFTELGIKGRRWSYGGCPVANYLKAETGLEDIEVDEHAAHQAEEPCDVSLPEHVTRFVENFDYRRYPQLEDLS